MSKTITDSVIALAAVSQAINCVHSIAQNGSAPQGDMDILIESTLQLSSDSVQDIYKDPVNLRCGLDLLIKQLKGPQTAEYVKYLAGILNLQKRLMADQTMLSKLASKLQNAQRFYDYNDEINQELIEQLASIYSDTISTYSLKIQVNGKSEHLQSPSNQAKIRTMLLAAIRAAVLWSQVGGKKRHFVFKKNALITAAQELRRL